MDTEILKQLYTQYVGSEPAEIVQLPASGSNRHYFRLSGEQSLIGVIGELPEENKAFLYMDKHFLEQGLPVPKVFAESDDKMAYIQEDLGDTILFNAIEKARKTRVFGEEEKDCCRRLYVVFANFNSRAPMVWISHTATLRRNLMHAPSFGI